MSKKLRMLHKKYCAKDTAQAKPVTWSPFPGPQAEARDSLADEVFFGGSSGGGKMLDIETPIPTPTGWTTMGGLVDGDVILNESGGTTRVVIAHPVCDEPKSYRLTFDDNSSVDACADHLWLTYDAKELGQLTKLDPEWRAARRQRRKPRVSGNKSEKFTAMLVARNKAKQQKYLESPKGTVRTTQQIVDTLFVKMGHIRTNHAIPVAKPIDLPAKDYLLDPYLLGVWLGDGTTTTGSVTNVDQEIFEAFEGAGFKTGGWNDLFNITHRVYGLQQILRQIGVLGNKHVPPEYLRGSKEQRLALLQGLMDSDGTVKRSSGHRSNGNCIFDNTNKAIIDAVQEIICSLGWKCGVSENRAMLYGKDCGHVWSVHFSPTEYVFRLPRKRDLQTLKRRRTTRFRYIVKAELIPSKPMRCITVDNPTGLFLCGRSFIPTHNTALLVGLACTQHRKSLILRRESSHLNEVIDQLVEMVGRDNFKIKGNGGTATTPDGRVIECGGCKDEKDKEDYKGRPHDAKFFDELADFTESQYKFIIGWNRSKFKGQRCRVVSAGNPPTRSGGEWLIRHWRAWLDPKAGQRAGPGELRWYATIDGKEEEFPSSEPVKWRDESIIPTSRTFIPSFLHNNPILASTNYISRLQSLPEPLRSAYLKGDFSLCLTDDPWQVIPTAWIKEAMARWKPDGGKNRMSSVGLDIAYGGSDSTVFVSKHGNWISPFRKWKGVETDSGEKVAKLVSPLVVDRKVTINIDATSWGTAAFEALRQTHPNTTPILFGEGASNLTDARGVLSFRNMRAYAYWRLRDALDPELPEQIALPPDDDLLAELSAPIYESDSGKIKIKSKDDIKQRLGRSPDKADAVALAVFEMPIRKATAMFI